MKKVMNTCRLLAVAAAIIVSAAFAAAAPASGPSHKAPFELKWIGNHDESPIFKLSFNNTTTGEYNIVVKDENKDVLYTERLKGTNLTRLYKLQNLGTEAEPATIIFEVTDRSTNTTVVYRVNTTVQLVNATEVTITQ